MSRIENTQIKDIVRNSYNLDLTEVSPLKTYIPLKKAEFKPVVPAKRADSEQGGSKILPNAPNAKTFDQEEISVPDPTKYVTKVIDESAYINKKKQARIYLQQLDQQIKDKTKASPKKEKYSRNVYVPEIYETKVKRMPIKQNTAFSFKETKPLSIDISNNQSLSTFDTIKRAIHTTGQNQTSYNANNNIEYSDTADISLLKNKIALANEQFNSKLLEIQKQQSKIKTKFDSLKNAMDDLSRHIKTSPYSVNPYNTVGGYSGMLRNNGKKVLEYIIPSEQNISGESKFYQYSYTQEQYVPLSE